MTKKVDPELALEAVFGLAFRRHHHARVVDQDIEFWMGRDKLRREPIYGVQAGQIDMSGLDLPIDPFRFDALDRLVDPVRVATGDNDVGARLRQSQRRVIAYPGISPCNQDRPACLAREVLVNPLLEF